MFGFEHLVCVSVRLRAELKEALSLGSLSKHEKVRPHKHVQDLFSGVPTTIEGSATSDTIGAIAFSTIILGTTFPA